MPVSLSPNTVQSINSETTAISANHTDLSTFGWAANAAGAGGVSPYQFAAYLGKEKEDGGRRIFSEDQKKSSLSPKCSGRNPSTSHAHVFFNPAGTRLGVNGASRRRTPTASKIALAKGSWPAPRGIASPT